MERHEGIGTQIAAYLRDKMEHLPVEQAGDIYVQKVDIDTRRGIDVTGQPFEKYKRSTAKKKGRTSPVTLRDYAESIDTLSSEAISSTIAQLSFSGNSGKGGRDANEVFFDYHQLGTRKMPKRKIFPESGDENSAGMAGVIEQIGILIEKHFNE